MLAGALPGDPTVRGGDYARRRGPCRRRASVAALWLLMAHVCGALAFDDEAVRVEPAKCLSAESKGRCVEMNRRSFDSLAVNVDAENRTCTKPCSFEMGGKAPLSLDRLVCNSTWNGTEINDAQCNVPLCSELPYCDPSVTNLTAHNLTLKNGIVEVSTAKQMITACRNDSVFMIHRVENITLVIEDYEGIPVIIQREVVNVPSPRTPDVWIAMSFFGDFYEDPDVYINNTLVFVVENGKLEYANVCINNMSIPTNLRPNSLGVPSVQLSGQAMLSAENFMVGLNCHGLEQLLGPLETQTILSLIQVFFQVTYQKDPGGSSFRMLPESEAWVADLIESGFGDDGTGNYTGTFKMLKITFGCAHATGFMHPFCHEQFGMEPQQPPPPPGLSDGGSGGGGASGASGDDRITVVVTVTIGIFAVVAALCALVGVWCAKGRALGANCGRDELAKLDDAAESWWSSTPTLNEGYEAHWIEFRKAVLCPMGAKPACTKRSLELPLAKNLGGLSDQVLDATVLGGAQTLPRTAPLLECDPDLGVRMERSTAAACTSLREDKAAQKRAHHTMQVRKGQTIRSGVNEYLLLSELGKGATAVCFAAQDTRTQQLYAIKVPRFEGPQLYTNEVTLMRLLSHPCTVAHRESFVHARALYSVIEFCALGDLRMLMCEAKRHKSHIKEAFVARALAQLCLAMSHMHAAGIAHRDVKLSNVYVSVHGDVKLGDFGTSQFTADMFTSMVGTPLYMAPEVLRKEPYSLSSDIWSLGHLTYELCTFKPLYSPSSMDSLLEKHLTPYTAIDGSMYSAELVSLVDTMLTTAPAGRPTADDLLQTPYLRSAMEGLRESHTHALAAGRRQADASGTSLGSSAEGCALSGHGNSVHAAAASLEGHPASTTNGDEVRLNIV